MRFIKDHEIDLIINGMTHEPHHFLGMHELGESKGLVVRAWDPTAHEVKVRTSLLENLGR